MAAEPFKAAGQQAEAALLQAIRETAEDGLTAALENIDRMELYGATNWLSTSGYTVHLQDRSQFGFTAPYGADVNHGTPAHLVDVEDLTEWARIKFKLRPEEARRMAHAVRASIAKQGTKPKPFFSNAVERVRARLPGNAQAKLDQRLGSYRSPT